MQKKSPLNLISLSLALLFGVLILPLAASAQSDQLKEALEKVDQNVDKLAEIKETPKTSSPSEALPAEMRTMQMTAPIEGTPVDAESAIVDTDPEEYQAHLEALLSVVDFSVVEVADILKKLQSSLFATQDKSTKDAAQNIITLLNERKAYLAELYAQAATKEMSLAQIQSAAAELKIWRQNFYNPELKLGLDLPLITQAEEIINITAERLSKVASDVNKLQARIPSAKLAPLLKEADDAFQKARRYYENARDLTTGAVAGRLQVLSQYAEVTEEGAKAEVEVGTETKISDPEADAKAEAVSLEFLLENNLAVEDAHKTVQIYAEQVSQNIRATYRLFMEMSTRAKEALRQ